MGMYGLEELRKALSNPHLVLRELNRMYHRRMYTRPFNTDGINIFEEDWDNLIILDACRHDLFRQETDFEDVESRTSRGAATPEFIRGNFTDRKLHDVVYLTANTWFFDIKDEINSEVYVTKYIDDRDPTALTDIALEAAEEYPNKRLIVHFIPPHHPYKGPTAERAFPPYDEQSNALFERIQRGELDIDDETLQQAYIENFHRVLPEVETLLSKFRGKTVVTADHGELLGDRTAPVPIRDYGHHVGLYMDELVKIPWYESESRERPRIISEVPDSDVSEVEAEAVEQRLQELGYR